MDKEQLIQLAYEYGLPCIERDKTIFVIGLVEVLEFNQFDLLKLEENTK